MCPESTRQELAEADRHGDAAGTVYTYFHAVPELDEAEQHRQIETWKASWERYGWAPTVLGGQDCDGIGAEKAAEAEARFRTYPSTNPPGYDLACYMRWLALWAVGGGLMTDYDVVNVGLRPSALEEHAGHAEAVCLCRYWVPAVVNATRVGAAGMVAILLDHKPVGGHTSDMLIFQKHQPGPWLDLIAREWHEPDHGQPLVHCATSSLLRRGVAGPKSTIMEALLASTGARQ